MYTKINKRTEYVICTVKFMLKLKVYKTVGEYISFL